MLKVIVEKESITHEVFDGQIRANNDGRIVMIITDERFENYNISKTVRALVLREGRNGFAKPCTTVPRIYKTDEELITEFPKVLSGFIKIKGDD